MNKAKSFTSIIERKLRNGAKVIPSVLYFFVHLILCESGVYDQYIMVLCVFVLFRIIDNDSLRGFNFLKLFKVYLPCDFFH